MIKRLVDIIISTLLVLCLLPVLILIAISIKIDSPGAVLFKQRRVGRFGRGFLMYKFRSMVQGADKQGSFQTKVGDSRITRIGKFIRKTSIDELPQLINVIKGDMSLVGPRPNVFEQREIYELQDWEKRNSVRPGITGLAQARVRSNSLPGERTKLDLEYVDRQTFFYDIYIMALTIQQVVIKRNVN